MAQAVEENFNLGYSSLLLGIIPHNKLLCTIQARLPTGFLSDFVENQWYQVKVMQRMLALFIQAHVLIFLKLRSLNTALNLPKKYNRGIGKSVVHRTYLNKHDHFHL